MVAYNGFGVKVRSVVSLDGSMVQWLNGSMVEWFNERFL
jgi:hypothetical protein